MVIRRRGQLADGSRGKSLLKPGRYVLDLEVWWLSRNWFVVSVNVDALCGVVVPRLLFFVIDVADLDGLLLLWWCRCCSLSGDRDWSVLKNGVVRDAFAFGAVCFARRYEVDWCRLRRCMCEVVS